jgi:hypothetical protein
MRRDLDHLPSAKQREIERVLQILFEEFDAANGDATGPRKRARTSRSSSTDHMRGAAGSMSHTPPKAISPIST